MVSNWRATLCLGLLVLGGCAGLPASNQDVQVSEFRLAIAKAPAMEQSITVHRYAPARQAPRAALVFAHGFLRGPERHADLALRLASEGVLVLLPQLASPFDKLSLQRDAQVMLALDAEARRETATVLWGGFSRGGSVTAEALMLAAAGATGTAGTTRTQPAAILMLDPVWNARAAKLLSSLNIPVRVLAAPAAACNAQGRALVFPEARSLATDIVAGATHCDAESPSDLLCTVACGSPEPARQQQFLEAALVFVRTVLTSAASRPQQSDAAPLRATAGTLPADETTPFPHEVTAP